MTHQCPKQIAQRFSLATFDRARGSLAGKRERWASGRAVVAMIFCDSEMTLDAEIDGLEFRRVVACWGGGEEEGRESDGRDMLIKTSPGLARPGVVQCPSHWVCVCQSPVPVVSIDC